jgi:hypothetical protein
MTTIYNVADIAGRADGTKKPTKAQAYKMYVDVLRDLECGATAGPEHLAALYAFFAPSGREAKPKTPFQWVALAVAGKKDGREPLRFVHVEPTRMVATDGHRIHIAPNVGGLEPGFYDVAGVRVHAPDWNKYPDVDRVTPQLSSRETFNDRTAAGSAAYWAHPMHVDSPEQGVQEDNSGGPVRYVQMPGCLVGVPPRRETLPGARLDLRYWRDAFALDSQFPGPASVITGSPSDVVRIDLHDTDCTAVIAPLRY